MTRLVKKEDLVIGREYFIVYDSMANSNIDWTNEVALLTDTNFATYVLRVGNYEARYTYEELIGEGLQSIMIVPLETISDEDHFQAKLCGSWDFLKETL